MVNHRSSSTTQKKIGKVRTARAIVMVLLVMVAVAIILIDKKQDTKVIDVTHDSQSSTEKTTNPAISDSVYKLAVPPNNSVSQNFDTSKENSEKKSLVENKTNVRNINNTSEFSTSKQAGSQKQLESSKAVSSPNSVELKNNGSLPEFHCVAEGETLSIIAKKYYGKTSLWQVLYQANQSILQNPRSLRIGQKLKLPAVHVNRAMDQPKEIHQTKVIDQPKLMDQPSKPRKSKGVHPKTNGFSRDYQMTESGEAVSVSGKFHQVAKGETLSGIAKRENVSFLTLYDINREVLRHNPNFIREGMKIWVPSAAK